MTEDNLITINDFFKSELKTAKILDAEKIEESNKLIKLKVDAGEEENRQIIAGLAKYYQPEDLVNKQIVIVSNLQPAKLMGYESQGMLLAAKDNEGKLSLISPQEELQTGALVG